MSPAERAQLSADWLARLHASTSADPWTHGFSLVNLGTGTAVGTCGFKGPPASDGVVEIAYGVDPDHSGKGYATEAVVALVTYAFGSTRVRVVRAHTLPGPNALTRVLAKCGFRYLGEVLDPEDGLVWRWETHQEAAAEPSAAPDRPHVGFSRHEAHACGPGRRAGSLGGMGGVSFVQPWRLL